MADFRKVTDSFFVSPQIDESDLDIAASEGFKTVICNRPDGEGADQPATASLKAKAESLGLEFVELPFAGAPSPEIVAKQGDLVAAAEKPVLAFCRSGTRSITAWALSQSGTGRADEIIAAAAEAGYDLEGLRAGL